jgi:hypothetical protein
MSAHFINTLQSGINEKLDTIYEVKDGVPSFVCKSYIWFITPVWYTIRHGKWYWTADGSNWMSVNDMVVTGGKWKGCEPISSNQRIIKELRKISCAKASLYLAQKFGMLEKPEVRNDRPECVICLDNTAVYLAQPCNHLLYCSECYSSLSLCKTSCSVCRGDASFSKIFF